MRTIWEGNDISSHEMYVMIQLDVWKHTTQTLWGKIWEDITTQQRTFNYELIGSEYRTNLKHTRHRCNRYGS